MGSNVRRIIVVAGSFGMLAFGLPQVLMGGVPLCPPENGLVAWWRMETVQGNQIPDSTGNGHDLTINGAPTFEGPLVIFNDDGTLQAADSDGLDLLGDWSVSFWARPDSNDQIGGLGTTNNWIDKHRVLHEAEGGWDVVSHPVVRANIFNNPNCAHDTPTSLTLGQWYRITTTYESMSNTLRIYLDDNMEVEAIGTCSMLANTYPVILGGYKEADLSILQACKGAMGDVRIYDRAISPIEVSGLVQATTRTFVQGSGYAGCVDTSLQIDFPDTPFGSSQSIAVDFDPENHGLIRFDDIFGNAPNQVPLGAVITSATLTLNLSNQGGISTGVHRMLLPWEADDTWNDWGSGVQPDGIEAEVLPDATIVSTLGSSLAVDVTSSVQTWSDGTENLGWVLLPGDESADGWEFASADNSSEGIRPTLEVVFVFSSEDCDGDAVPEDGDGSGVAGDHPCVGGQTVGCDDNCPGTPNPGQENADGDEFGDACDACRFDAEIDADGDGVCGDVDQCPDTIGGVSVDACGCPPFVPGDLDRDGDVDQDDFGIFQRCSSGPGIPGDPDCDDYEPCQACAP